MLLAVDSVNHTVSYQCEHCRCVHEEHPISPKTGHIRVSADDVALHCLACGLHDFAGVPCGRCGTRHGASSEHFPFDHVTDYDTGEVQHPDSLVGFKFEDTGGVVVTDSRYDGSNPMRRLQARHILALQRHPHVVAARAKVQQG